MQVKLKNPKILVVGCSMTKGHGLLLEKNDPKLWINQILNNVFDDPVITNLSHTGKNNHWICIEAVHAIIKNHYDIIIIGWSELARFNFNVGLELYKTETRLTEDVSVDINTGITISGKWLADTGDRLRKIHNDHWSILDLVKYVNILSYHAKLNNSKLYFVNTLFKLPQDFFCIKEFSTPNELSKFEQNMFNVETRDDDEIKKLYNMVHQQYKEYGGIQENMWLNLYQSFRSMQIDDASSTDVHPGYASQDLFAEYLLPILREKLNAG